MDISKLVTNCPNCGGELTSDGYCQYCDTKVRLANAMEIETGQFVSKPVEIEIRVKRGDETIIIPFEGYLQSIDIQYETTDIYFDNKKYAYMLNRPSVDLTFSGHLLY